MKSNLSYLKFDTLQEFEDYQNQCHLAHIAFLSNDADYKSTTTRFSDPFKPEGEDFYVMRIPSVMRIGSSLKTTLAVSYKDIPIVKSKSSWVKISEEVV
jgi:hypothetical protein